MHRSQDWHDIAYLQKGTVRQQETYHLLKEHRILQILQHFDPVLVGTVPIEIDVANSDLDIICEIQESWIFERCVRSAFQHLPGFQFRNVTIHGVHSCIANFDIESFPIELFGQPIPVRQQNAYRHMEIEARLLIWAGEPAREAIRELKCNGLKTEPAFAQYFGIPGDPYQTLLDWATLPEEKLHARISRKKSNG